jgi:DNA-binding NarL/FixJ family response regulator
LKKDLTNREQEILRLLAEGKANRQIAEQLGISVRTVEGHRARVMLKLGLSGLSDLVRYAVREKIIEV